MKSRILVVDDDPSILELLRFLLESEGYRVIPFDSAADALKAAINRPPDVAIVDLMMPGMNGLELVQAFRYDSRTQQIPVLLCSAYYGDLRYITTKLNLNNTSFLRKPFQIQDLLDRVANMVSSSRRLSQKRTTCANRKLNGEKETASPEPAFISQIQSDTAATLVQFSTIQQNRGNSPQTQRTSRNAPGVAAGQPRGRRR
ncbi:MAG: response regulator [Chloroflexota bacterium]